MKSDSWLLAALAMLDCGGAAFAGEDGAEIRMEKEALRPDSVVGGRLDRGARERAGGDLDDAFPQQGAVQHGRPGRWTGVHVREVDSHRLRSGPG